MKYAIKYHRTPEEWARFVNYTCRDIGRNGYNMRDYYGRQRMEDIAQMIEALKLNVTYDETLQLMDREQFDAVYKILEWDNCHTENLAFSLAFGDAAAVFDALRTIHYAGQNYAIDNELKYPEQPR